MVTYLTMRAKLCNLCRHMQLRECRLKNKCSYILKMNDNNVSISFRHVGIMEDVVGKNFPPKCTGNPITCTFNECMCDILNKRELRDFFEKS